jgi:hypothetical protein
VALPAGPALAHVTIQSPGASQGGYAKVTFRVPAEKPLATTRLQVVFPADAPLGSVRVKPHPGPVAGAGVNGLHVYTLGAGGRTVDVAEVAGELVGADGTTVTVRPAHRSLGHYEDLGVVLPVRGTWRLDLQIRTNDVDSYPTTQTITVR